MIPNPVGVRHRKRRWNNSLNRIIAGLVTGALSLCYRDVNVFTIRLELFRRPEEPLAVLAGQACPETIAGAGRRDGSFDERSGARGASRVVFTISSVRSASYSGGMRSNSIPIW